MGFAPLIHLRFKGTGLRVLDLLLSPLILIILLGSTTKILHEGAEILIPGPPTTRNSGVCRSTTLLFLRREGEPCNGRSTTLLLGLLS